VALQKGANQDFILGEITLPLIFLLQSLSVVDKERAIRIMETRDLEGLGWLSSQIKHSSVVGECGNLIRHYRDRCLSVVSPIPANPFAEILKQIVGVVADRGLVF
jgi:geranylgeranyl pyrophosphate synthase